MTLDLAALKAAHTGQELDLLRSHINPRFAKVGGLHVVERLQFSAFNGFAKG